MYLNVSQTWRFPLLLPLDCSSEQQREGTDSLLVSLWSLESTSASPLESFFLDTHTRQGVNSDLLTEQNGFVATHLKSCIYTMTVPHSATRWQYGWKTKRRETRAELMIVHVLTVHNMIMWLMNTHLSVAGPRWCGYELVPSVSPWAAEPVLPVAWLLSPAAGTLPANRRQRMRNGMQAQTGRETWTPTFTFHTFMHMAMTEFRCR